MEFPTFDDIVSSERLVNFRNEMRIEQRLIEVSRGRLLSSSQTPREEWVDALHDLSAYNGNVSSPFDLSCLYSLIRLHPNLCLLELNDTANPGN